MPRGNKIQIRTGSGAPSPADFAASEPAWDGVSKLYVKSNSGTMVEVGGGSSSVAVYASVSAFPATGSESVLYLAEDTSRLYQWDSTVYVEVGGSGGGVIHASTHATGGADAITPASIGAAAASHSHDAGDIATGTLATARLGSGTASSSTFLAGDQSWKAVTTTKTLQRFTARDNQPPASNFATLDTRNSVLVLEYDAATEESATFVGVINEAATLTSGLVVRIWWMGDTATSGNVRWGVQFERSGTDLDADSYDTNAQVTSAANATSGVESVAEITITTIDSLAAGDRFRLRVYRVAADATNDTMTGDAQLVAVEVRAA